MKPLLYFLASVGLLHGQGWTDLGANTRLGLGAPADGWNAGTVQNGYTQENYAWSSNFYKILDYSGGAVDTKRSRLLVTGGGHSAYPASNVYAVNLTGTPSVQQLNPPSVEDGTANTLCTANGINPSDNSPVSRHTYGSVVYIPTTDKLFMIDGGNFCATSQLGMFRTWLFDLSTNAGWTDASPGGTFDPTSPGGADPNTGSFCSFDPNTIVSGTVTATLGSVWCYGSGGEWPLRYDVAANTWTKMAPFGTINISDLITSVIDPVRRKWYFIGIDNSFAGRTYVVDLAPGSSYAPTDITSSLSGCSALYVLSPGLAYDPSRGVIVGWPNAGNSVIVFDPQTYSCTAHTYAGGPGTDSATTITGTHGRWGYVPALKGFAVLNSTNLDTFLFKLDRDPVPGLGASTLTCLDKDGDGYGVGPGCTGVDSDDRDATIHTADQGCTKYGGTTCATQSSLVAFLKHLGYSATGHIYYLSNSGVNASTSGTPNCQDAIGSPCLTYGYLTLAADDIVLLRNGYNSVVTCVAGTLGHPSVLMSYPGEQALFDAVAVPGGGISCYDSGYMIFDGFKFKLGGYLSLGTATVGSTDLSPNITISHMETVDGGTHVLDSVIAIRRGSSNLLIEDSVFHDNTDGHGLYVGTQGGTPSIGGIIQRNISYGNAVTGFQTTGNIQFWTIQQNMAYNTGGACFSHEAGMSHSRDLSNLCFNQGAAGIVTFSYPGNEGTNNCGVGGTSLCTCGPPNAYAICAYPQNYNVYAHNTLYNTGHSGFDGSDVSNNPSGITVGFSGCDGSTPFCLASTFDNNTYQNNIIAAYGGWFSRESFYYKDQDGLCPSGAGKCQEWLSTSSLDHNLGYQTNGGGNTTYLGFEQPSLTANYLSVAGAAAYTTTTGSSVASPPFVAASIAYYNSVGSFDFRLSSNVTGTTSPAVYDLLGNFRSAPTPSLGAYEYQGAASGNGGSIRGGAFAQAGKSIVQ